MTSAIDGLVSGLDTTSLISQLMTVEAMPQTALKTKQTTASKVVTALQSVNTKTASLATVATTASTASSWKAATATSSSTAATASVTGTPQAGSLSFTVDQIAKPQVSLSNLVADDNSLVSDSPPKVTVRKADGTFLTVEPASGSLADVTSAINDAADAGVRATLVRVSNGTTAQYRIQFTGTTTGSDGSFEIFAGTQAEVEAATSAGTDQSLRIDQNSYQAAQNAKVTLWKGNAALEQSVEQSSNTFSSLLTGVDITVSAVTGTSDDPTTVTVGKDAAAVLTTTKNFMSGLSLLLSDITSQTKTTSSTDSSGNAKVTGGTLSGDSAIRNLQQQLVSAATLPVGGLSPSTVGLTYGTDGTFTFDEDAFTAAYAADPDAVEAMITGLASRVETVATSASDSTTGTLSLKIANKQSSVSSLGDQIDDWDVRIALRRTALEKTYAALEVSLSNLNAQSSWLTSAIESLSTSTS